VSQPIYKFWMAKFTAAYYELSQAEKDAYWVKNNAAFKQAGGERLIYVESFWSNERWQAMGVEKFPSLEAEHQFAQALNNMEHFRYIESVSYLGTEPPPS
jgi:hypothetical protein